MCEPRIAASALKVALNFAVPFCVSSYSAACHEARRRRGD
jgi:hypothetical protein